MGEDDLDPELSLIKLDGPPEVLDKGEGRTGEIITKSSSARSPEGEGEGDKRCLPLFEGKGDLKADAVDTAKGFEGDVKEAFVRFDIVGTGVIEDEVDEPVDEEEVDLEEELNQVTGLLRPFVRGTRNPLTPVVDGSFCILSRFVAGVGGSGWAESN
jgi:hypothetical protein